jgi:hypothetical protein
MGENFTCEFCNKNFSTKGNLSVHKKRAKKCLELQKKDESSLFNCHMCSKTFSSKQRLESHIEKCNRGLWLSYKEIETKYELSKYEVHTLKQQLKQKDKQIKELQEKLSNLAEIGAKKETSTIRVQTNIMNQLVPYDLDKNKIRTIVNEHFNENYLCGKEQGIASFAITNLLQDKDGNLKMTCTDTSRKIFVYKDKDGNLYKDVNASGFLESYIPAVKHKSFELLSEKETYEMLELSECITNIQESTVSSHLAGKLVPKPMEK